MDDAELLALRYNSHMYDYAFKQAMNPNLDLNLRDPSQIDLDSKYLSTEIYFELVDSLNWYFGINTNESEVNTLRHLEHFVKVKSWKNGSSLLRLIWDDFSYYNSQLLKYRNDIITLKDSSVGKPVKPRLKSYMEFVENYG